ncbi:unnamed protein product [Rotaria sordida]|uniref:F-box domain-containing protein n=1 Tax=Rotaria sordida TaxID=392033 RepID=A0A815ASN6_9BILA|nr:unnamed protein product [Rotaria sordida]CAF1261300.1 unnamed protein product [Rotaria sordida]
MKLESLPNELLLDLFKYFSTVQLLRSFNDLNSRFNNLLFHDFRDYHLDFRSISRDNFKILCQQYLPVIIDQVSSLRLANDDDDSPQQIDLFFSHVSSTDDNADYDLQILLNEAHCLYSLEITSWPSSLIPLVKNTSKSVRRLDLRQLTICHQQDSNSSSRTQNYRKFGCSRLGIQCEILRIATESEADILALVDTMTNIRVLYTTCTSDIWKYADNVSSSKKFEFIELLKSSLPSTSIITRVSGLYGFLQLWFR